MPAGSPATQHVDWKAAETAVAAGVPFPDVAQSLGIKFWTLWKRAQRGKWFIPSTALKRAEKAAREHQQSAAKSLQASNQAGSLGKALCPKLSNGPFSEGENGEGSTEKRSSTDEKIGALMLQTLERNDDRASLLASGIAVKALEKASKRKKPIELDTIAEVDKALMVTKRAAGKDRDEQGVTVNLFSPQAGARPVESARSFRVRVQEAEVIESKAVTQ